MTNREEEIAPMNTVLIFFFFLHVVARKTEEWQIRLSFPSKGGSKPVEILPYLIAALIMSA